MKTFPNHLLLIVLLLNPSWCSSFSQDDKLYVSNSFTIYHPDCIPKTYVLSPVSINGYKLTEKQLSFPTYLPKPTFIEAPIRSNVASILYTTPENLPLTYVRANTDKNWMYAGYKNLLLGKSISQIVNFNRESLWNNRLLSGSIWASWWTYGLYTIILFAGIYILIKQKILQRKPFTHNVKIEQVESEKIQMLESQVKGLLEACAELQEKYNQLLLLKAQEIQATSADKRFLEKALTIIEANIGNTEFDVECFSREIGMSRAHLHRKLTALTAQPPSEFIRNFRLKRAASLLLQHCGNVSEVAYQVGFSSLNYFTKCFKEYHGKTPTEYQKSNLYSEQEG